VVRRQGLERRVVPARDGVEHPLELLLGAVGALVRGRGGEDPAREQEGTADLLVSRYGEWREAFGRRTLGRREEKPCLSDAGLTPDQAASAATSARFIHELSELLHFCFAANEMPFAQSRILGFVHPLGDSGAQNFRRQTDRSRLIAKSIHVRVENAERLHLGSAHDGCFRTRHCGFFIERVHAQTLDGQAFNLGPIGAHSSRLQSLRKHTLNRRLYARPVELQPEIERV
jgi:hypothetical protein